MFWFTARTRRLEELAERYLTLWNKSEERRKEAERSIRKLEQLLRETANRLDRVDSLLLEATNSTGDRIPCGEVTRAREYLAKMCHCGSTELVTRAAGDESFVECRHCKRIQEEV